MKGKCNVTCYMIVIEWLFQATGCLGRVIVDLGVYCREKILGFSQNSDAPFGGR